MKLKIFTILFSFLIIIGCSTQKEVNQRRNLMIPQKDELPRNSKYKSSKQKKTTKTVTKKKKKKSKR